MRQSVIGSTSRSSANPLWLIPSFRARYVSTCHCDRVSPEPRAFCSNLLLSNRATSCSKKSRVDEFASIDVLTSNRCIPERVARNSTCRVQRDLRSFPSQRSSDLDRRLGLDPRQPPRPVLAHDVHRLAHH